MPEDLVRAEDLGKYHQVASHVVSYFSFIAFFHLVMHSFLLLSNHNDLYLCFIQGLHSASVPGILALDLCPSDTSKVLTGTLFLFSSGSLKLMFLQLTVKMSGGFNKHHLFFQVELIRMWWYLTKMRSRLWQHLRVTPRRSPLLFTIHPRYFLRIRKFAMAI